MKRSADPNSDKMRAEFRQKLENYQAAPSENLWDKIEISLDKEEALVYKNRFRVYSRLAAACVLFLLAFGAFFIPNKLKQIKSESAEIAAVQNPEKYSSPTTQQHLSETESLAAAQPEMTSETPKPTKQPSENAMVLDGKTAAALENQNATTSNLISTPAAPETHGRNAFSSEKTVAFHAQKVKPKAQTSGRITAETASQNPQNVMVPAAKTANPETRSTETKSASEAANIAADPAMAIASETEKPAATNISELAASGKKASAETEMPATVSGKQQHATAAAWRHENATEQPEPANAFAQKPGLVLKKEPFKALPFLKTQLLPLQNTAQAKTALPDTNILAAVPEMQENLETANPATKLSKTGKWQVALAYTGRSFSPGMRLAGQATFLPNAGNITSNQKQKENIALYEAAIQEFNQETRPAYSQGASLQVAYKLSENWQLQSGLAFFRNQAQTASQYTFNTSDSGTITASLQTASPQTTLETVLFSHFHPEESEISSTRPNTNVYVFDAFSIPLNLRYLGQINPKLYYFAGAGLAMHVLTEASIRSEDQHHTYPVKYHNSNASYFSVNPVRHVFRKWLPAAGLESGFGYKLTEKWQLETALEAEQFLKPLIQAEDVAGTTQQLPRSLGGSAKVVYSF